MKLSSLLPRMFRVGVVVNYVGLIAYLIFVTIGMNIEFVCRDPAKLGMHLGRVIN